MSPTACADMRPGPCQLRWLSIRWPAGGVLSRDGRDGVSSLGSARTEGDSWDLASSVGATATMVATSRALASRDPDPLLDDRFAEPLVRAVGHPFFIRMLDGEIPFDNDEVPLTLRLLEVSSRAAGRPPAAEAAAKKTAKKA